MTKVPKNSTLLFMSNFKLLRELNPNLFIKLYITLYQSIVPIKTTDLCLLHGPHGGSPSVTVFLSHNHYLCPCCCFLLLPALAIRILVI